MADILSVWGLAAVAAAWALNLPIELVHAGLLHMRKSVAMSAYH